MSPQLHARVAGLLYLYIIVAGIFAEVFVRSKLTGPTPAATLQNIAANEQTFRLGISAELLHLACDVAVTAILYLLLRPVHRTLALIAAWMRLACIIVLATVSVTQFVALRLALGAWELPAAQAGSIAQLALRLHSDGYNISLVFFGFGCIVLGWLIFRSAYLPRVIGVLMAIAGVCYAVNSFARFLAPEASRALFPAILLPPFVAELSLALWLLVRGVNVDGWRQRTATV